MGYRSVFEEPDQKRSRDVQNAGGLDGCQLGVLGDDGHAASGRHRFEDIHEEGDGACRKLDRLLLLGLDAKHKGTVCAGKARQALARRRAMAASLAVGGSWRCVSNFIRPSFMMDTPL